MPNALKQRRVATAFEREIAEDLGGRRIFLSGAGFDKADVRKGAEYTRDATGRPTRTDALAFRVEAKTTSQRYFNFTQQDWKDLVKAAVRSGEHPLFVIRFLEHQLTLAIVRRSLAQDLALPAPEHVSSMIKCYRLEPYWPVTLQLRLFNGHGKFRNEEVCVVHYRDFLEGLRAYEPS